MARYKKLTLIGLIIVGLGLSLTLLFLNLQSFKDTTIRFQDIFDPTNLKTCFDNYLMDNTKTYQDFENSCTETFNNIGNYFANFNEEALKEILANIFNILYIILMYVLNVGLNVLVILFIFIRESIYGTNLKIKASNPDEIIAFTFTNRAVKEMIYRLKDYKFENVYTFHKYSFSILSRYKDEIGYVKKKRINIVDDEYQYVLLEEILNDLDSPYNQRFIKDYISKRKNNIQYKYKNTEEAGILNNIFYKYQSLLSQREMLDFDDMVSMLVNNIDNFKLKDDILNHCKYILVDEFQDTNKIQYDLLTKLSSKYHNLFCVGDEDQCATRS